MQPWHDAIQIVLWAYIITIDESPIPLQQTASPPPPKSSSSFTSLPSTPSPVVSSSIAPRRSHCPPYARLPSPPPPQAHVARPNIIRIPSALLVIFCNSRIHVTNSASFVQLYAHRFPPSPSSPWVEKKWANGRIRPSFASPMPPPLWTEQRQPTSTPRRQYPKIRSL